MISNDNRQLTEVLALIANHEGITLSEITRRTGISSELLMKNLITFADNMENDHLSISYEEEETMEDSVWFMDNRGEDYCYLALTPFEKILFNQMLGERDRLYTHPGPIIMKELYDVRFDEKKIVQIIAAIKRKKVLSIKYVRPDQVIMDFILKPAALYYYELENLFYVAGFYEEEVLFYRLDRIKEINETSRFFTLVDQPKIENLLDDVFGMELGEPTRISIRFYDEGNVIRKVKREAGHLSSMFVEDSQGLRLEGTIRGIQKMKAWIRSFGSSAVVLEPKWLREEIIETAKLSLTYYNER